MGKNIMDLYKTEEVDTTLTTESAVTAMDTILAHEAFADAVLTTEEAMSDYEVVAATSLAITKFQEDFAPAEAALAAGEVTPEIAQIAVQAYTTMIESLNFTPANLEDLGATTLSTEDSIVYPEATVKLTTEGATKLIETIKTKVMEIITRIAAMLKTTAVKIAAYALGNEDSAVKLSKQVNDTLTDELKDGREIEFEFVASRMAVFGSLTKANLLALVKHANNESVAGGIKTIFDKDLAAKEFKGIFILANKLPVVNNTLFENKDKDYLVNVYALAADGDSVSALVTRKKENGGNYLAKETVKITKLDGFKGNKPLTRKEIVEVAAEIVSASKKQKDLVKKITDYVTMPKIPEGGDVKFLQEVPVILNHITAAFISLAMSSATTNRSALAILANSASLYKKKEASSAK